MSRVRIYDPGAEAPTPASAPRWARVEVVAPVGYEFGVVGSADGPVLTLVVRAPREPWPHGEEPNPLSRNVIRPGFTRYSVAAGGPGPDDPPPAA